MEEWIPYLLIVIGWNPASDAGPQLVERSVMPSQELCEQEGSMFVAEHEGASSMDEQPLRYRHFCVPAPSYEERSTAIRTIEPEGR